MSSLPCLNPNCKSNGRPHPNCKCYGGMADGGEVKSFCEMGKAHNSDCEYYADGGEVPSDDLPSGGQPVGAGLVPPGDMLEEAPQVPIEDLPQDIVPNEEKYGTPEQQTLTGVEGVAQGFAGPVESALSTVGNLLPAESMVPLGLKKYSLTPEDIKARQEANPAIHASGELAGLVGGALTGTGLAGLASKGAGKIAEAANLGKIGASALAGAISNGAIQGADEVSKGLLGQGDPTHAVGSALANMGAAGLFGGLVGGVSGKISSALSSAADSKLGSKLNDFVSGFGSASQGNTEAEGASKAFKAGVKAFNNVDKGVTTLGTATNAYRGYQKDGITGGLEGAIYGSIGAHGLTKYGTQALTRMMSSGAFNNVGKALDYANHVDSGLQKTTRAVNSLFGGAGQQLINDTNAGNKLKDYIKNGGINQTVNDMLNDHHDSEQPVQGYAKGGEVVPTRDLPQDDMPEDDVDPMATIFPEHHVALEAAKGRISNYLKSLEPSEITPKLAFDDEPDKTQQEKTYNHAIEIANQPLNLMNKIKDGTIEPEHIMHLEALHPEVSELLKQKIMEGITRAQIDGKKPSYTIRQGMSMFLGTPLSSEMTPSSIQAAQAVFRQNNQGSSQQQGEPITKNKKDTSSLGKVSGQYLTSEQARSKEAQKVN